MGPYIFLFQGQGNIRPEKTMEKNRKYVALGKFTLTGDMLRVTDPCYTKETWCAGVIENMKPGEYNAYVAYDADGRVEMLLVAHSTYKNARQMANKIAVDDDKIWYQYWKMIDAEIGVDSGQCGLFDEQKVFDATQFTEVPDCGFECDNAWYATCCALTLSSKQAGVVPCGAVSSSGWGDGCYPAFVLRDAEDIGVAACIVYA